MWRATFNAGNRHVQFDKRGCETGRCHGPSSRAHPRLYHLAVKNGSAQWNVAMTRRAATRATSSNFPKTGRSLACWGVEAIEIIGTVSNAIVKTSRIATLRLDGAVGLSKASERKIQRAHLVK